MSDDQRTVDLLEQLRSALDDAEPLLTGRVVDIEMARLQVLVDPPRFRREFGALVEAATTDPAAMHPITVRVRRTGSTARIEVFSDHDERAAELAIGSMTVRLAPGTSHAAHA